MEQPVDFEQQLRSVLNMNDQGSYIVPAEGIYPHQWLWDSCFIAIGQRHYDVDRAQTELLSLLRGQWANGMLPNIVLSGSGRHGRGRDFWRSWVNPNAPFDYATSGLTQPPMLAEAVVRVGQKLSMSERRTWYHKMYQPLLKHHQWLYKERDPHKEGLVLLIHPWESGLDNSPPWMFEVHQATMPLWIKAVKGLHLEPLINLFRHDTHFVPAEERLSTIDGLILYSAQRRLLRKRYNIDKILPRSLFTIEDVVFNSIFIRANTHLKKIAKTINIKLPQDLIDSMSRTEKALEQLWDTYSNQYYSRNFVTHKLIREPSIGSLMPLYAGTISKERAEKLVSLLHSRKLFGADFPVPSVPFSSTYFKPHSYWQGPTWLNTNWLIADGLDRYGYKKEARIIRAKSLQMVSKHGSYEYFSPNDGSPAGAKNFSWTAALAMDMLHSKEFTHQAPTGETEE